MISIGLTTKYGVIACDSKDSKEEYSVPRLYMSSKGNALFSYTGSHLYLNGLDLSKFSLPFNSVCLYLKEYFLKTLSSVAEMEEDLPSKEGTSFCLLVLGVHNKRPTAAKFSVENKFKPVYVWSEKSIVFLSSGNKAETETISKKYTKLSPGIVGEILSKGIYKNGISGVVNCASIDMNEKVFPLSTYQIV